MLWHPQAVDLPSLDTDALLAHLDRCAANYAHGSDIHFGLGSVQLGSAFGTPLNDFLGCAHHWTGCDARTLIDCMAGHSAPTVIATNPEGIIPPLSHIPNWAPAFGCFSADTSAD